MTVCPPERVTGILVTKRELGGQVLLSESGSQLWKNHGHGNDHLNGLTIQNSLNGIYLSS